MHVPIPCFIHQLTKSFPKRHNLFANATTMQSNIPVSVIPLFFAAIYGVEIKQLKLENAQFVRCHNGKWKKV
jgi:hypothetical protein